jgi:REP element-mobilizing transposase RayT
LIVNSIDGKLSDVVRDLKKYTSKKIIKICKESIESRRKWMLAAFEQYAKKHSKKSKYQVWTHENHAEVLYTQKFTWQKLNYIHKNPVSAGIVEKPEDYLYSSARNYAEMDALLDVVLLDRTFYSY